MDLGRRLKQARLDAGLSQRQLCGTEITRNMLSQIENGNARPSMDTLRYLAARLNRPVSYFLEENAVVSPNQTVMAQARAAWKAGHIGEAQQALKEYRPPDPVFDLEKELLETLTTLWAARDAMAGGRQRYAAELLEKLEQQLADRRVLAIGEVGLTGEIRAVSNLSQRLSEVHRLGFTRCLIPKQGTGQLEGPQGLELIRVRNIREAIEFLL